MRTSTTSPKPVQIAEKCAAALLWLLIWQGASAIIKQEMLLASPVSVARALFALVQTAPFWRSVLFSLSRMGAGFLLAFGLGVLLAALSYRLRLVSVFLSPFISVVKAAPVASYTIICLLFLPSRNLSACISFLMALPIVYTNVLEGLHSTNRQLLEMANVFRVPKLRQVVFIYFSELMPFLVSACSLSLGICWKSGIAAEVIGLPRGSIGENMYQAKVFVDTKALLAWTIVVILISFLFEKVVLALLKQLINKIERM